jgi:hypothetical protein
LKDQQSRIDQALQSTVPEFVRRQVDGSVNPSASVSEVPEMVPVISPSGQRGSVKTSELPAAMKSGYRPITEPTTTPTPAPEPQPSPISPALTEKESVPTPSDPTEEDPGRLVRYYMLAQQAAEVAKEEAARKQQVVGSWWKQLMKSISEQDRAADRQMNR